VIHVIKEKINGLSLSVKQKQRPKFSVDMLSIVVAPNGHTRDADH
jgi:hypothetical protein